MSTALVWLRRDLRLADNPALARAAREHDAVVPVFCFERRLTAGRHSSPNRNAYLLACLAELDEALQGIGGRLHCRAGDPGREIAALAHDAEASSVYACEDHTAYARRRDHRVGEALAGDDVELLLTGGIACADVAAIETSSGGPYGVFTPFCRAWKDAPRREVDRIPHRLEVPSGLVKGSASAAASLGIDAAAKRIAESAKPGERAAARRLDAFMRRVADYAELNDLPGTDGTSRLSPALHFGTVSPLAMEQRLRKRRSKGAEALRRQLAWRDFYLHLMHHNPGNARREYQQKFRGMRWRSDRDELDAWKQGRTGYPLIDAGMRQLAETGWMHNRVRLAVASFLTKDLLIDWREGEAHFMRHLLDGDEANNNGNWQWTASVGADAQPYYRIFNPMRQQRRFDPDGAYVRRWSPSWRDYRTAGWPSPGRRRRRFSATPAVSSAATTRSRSSTTPRRAVKRWPGSRRRQQAPRLPPDRHARVTGGDAHRGSPIVRPQVATTGTVEIQMPQMGESVTEGTVLEWHKQEGDFVEEGETVVEVSTDKVDAEVPAPASGKLTKIHKAEDETVLVGAALAELDTSADGAASGNGASAPAAESGQDLDAGSDFVEGGGEGDADVGEDSVEADSAKPGEVESPAADTETAQAEAPTAAEGEAVQLLMPEMGESVTEGTVLEYHKQEGDLVEEGETVVEVSTDKVDAEVPAPASGTITKLFKQPDDTVKVGEALAEISASGAAAAKPTVAAGGEPGSDPATPGREAEEVAGGNGEDGHRASPVARRVAAANGVDIGSVKGSGPGGRVTKADVLAAEGGNGAAATAVAAGEAKPLRGPAGMLAKAMDESRAIPTATSFRTLAVDTLDAKRKALNGVLKERGMKVSFTHLVAWAIVRATEDWPVMARSFEERDGKPHAIEPGQINLGIAVDVERKGSRSLMVPAIKGSDGLDFAGFHSYYEELINKTRENKLTADDFQSTNITLTNPGGLGTIASVPRLMTGQGTIVATGSIAYPVEWQHAPDDKVKALGISKVMTMTSTYDHRIIQGAESGSFLRRIDQLLQGEDEFYESVAEALGLSPSVVASAHPASASAPPLAGIGAPVTPATGVEAKPEQKLLQAVQAATSLLKAYRTHGHLAAHLDPLGSEPKGDPALAPENLNLTPELMSQIPASILRCGVPGETLLEALPRMRQTYCGTIGYQFEHLSSHQQRMWLREMIETDGHRQPLSAEEKKRLLSRLLEVFVFERFIQKSYLGQKVFSIEGLDAVVPMLDELATLSRRAGAEEVVIGMAHRGRLSVLAHNLGRSVESLFAEFEGAKGVDAVRAIAHVPHKGTGDVKYHHGAEGMFETGDGGQIKMRLYPNPSHLEFVDPVVTGAARAAQTEHSGPMLHHTPSVAAPVLLHGDAAFPAQGVVAETFNLLGLEGYKTGGTVHIITDNQVGFTTDPHDSRSTPYASDMAKGFNVPIIHVNADDVEACIAAVRLSIAYREKFARDVVIDLIGYRRYGHNETDEAAYTQPKMAAEIKAHPPVSEIYAEQLVKEGVVSAEDVDRDATERREQLSAALKQLRQKIEAGDYEDHVSTATGTGELDRTKSPEVETAVSDKRLRSLNEELLKVPESFAIHRKLRKPLFRRRDALTEGGIEFGHAESLAYASLLTEGTHIRLTGQDTERGTFSNRHLVLHDEKTGLEYAPIQHLSGALAPFEIYNSPLSETACLGFEYGYSAASPESLVLWEAQFGDFANSAQVIIDSFIASGESKWGQQTRLTLLLPHGYEGSGPEHSSARIERFIALAAEGNIRLANPTTAAQYFHLLRRQARIAKPRPLVVFTPKGLLRLEAATSSFEELTGGNFQFVIDDPRAEERRDDVERLVLCSGKVYYDIDSNDKRETASRVAIARVELLYPFARQQIKQVITRYPNLKQIVWTQEEPQNMGAWKVMARRMPELVPEGVDFRYVGRPERASPSEGYPAAHRSEQERIVLTALEG